MQGLQSFQGLCFLDPYQGPGPAGGGGGLTASPRLPAVSGNDRWSLHVAPLTQCEYSVIIRDMDFSFLPLTGHQLFWKFLLMGQELFPWVFPTDTGPVLSINNEQSLNPYLNGLFLHV